MMFCSGVLASIGDLCFEVCINQYTPKTQDKYTDVCLYVRQMSRNILWIYNDIYIFIIELIYIIHIYIYDYIWQSNVWLCVSTIACQDDRHMSVSVYNTYYAIYNIYIYIYIHIIYIYIYIYMYTPVLTPIYVNMSVSL